MVGSGIWGFGPDGLQKSDDVVGEVQQAVGRRYGGGGGLVVVEGGVLDDVITGRDRGYPDFANEDVGPKVEGMDGLQQKRDMLDACIHVKQKTCNIPPSG